MNTFKSLLKKFDGKLWYYYIEVPQRVKEKYVTGNDRRVIITINDSAELPCAIMPSSQGFHFININKEFRKKLKLNVGDSVSIKIKKDESKYGMPMPEEFAEILFLDPEVDTLFHALTPGKQRSLLYLIGKPKGLDTRIKKAIVISEHLKRHKGKLDFKLLNQEYKDYEY